MIEIHVEICRDMWYWLVSFFHDNSNEFYSFNSWNDDIVDFDFYIIWDGALSGK